MAETFPFGKYLGHSVAYVAFHDYSWLGWIDRKGIRRPSLKQEVFKARQALNSFAPVEKCYTCNQTARVFSIAGNLMAWNIEGAYLYCDKTSCQNANGYDGMRLIYPIKFDTILSFAGDEWREPNYAIKRFQKVLNECVGIQGKLTENNCNDFLDSLVAKLAPKPPAAPPVPKQLELF